MPQATFVKNMFNNISGTYDVLNDLLSLGIHRLWKKKLVSEALKDHPDKILDCATGTGDIAISMKYKSPMSMVTGIDFSARMLDVAREKTDSIEWQEQDIMNLQFAPKTFDVTTISYGIRNVEDTGKALQQMARVTKNKILILEFGQPQNGIFKFLYFAIMKYFIPFLGKVFRKEDAYKYLIESSSRFPCADDFSKHILENTEFDTVKYIPMFGGVTYLYIVTKES
jgi:demethylmenaquinone methyltransferase/2-methoxy-6-polyprenyl-1,4-benzoquinol methylase